ncbi:hypothetical protein ACLMJK_007205 [Lecanora helva]
MVPSLRRGLVCFYCGCRSAHTRTSQIRRWQCEKCEAVNHLDENGEITDPPAAEISANARCTQPIQRLTSSSNESPQDALFCKTCQKNQLILSESLASYFPSEDTPNYADYEKHYPTFRRELEQRYPQVCEECEPRVRERIRATGYAAKTDHLRRLMERTRGGGVSRSDTTRWKCLLVFLGGTTWSLSIAGQIVWDGVALLSQENHSGVSLDAEVPSIQSACLHQVMRGSALPSDCASLMNTLARFALLLGLISFWWNPKLQERLTKAGGRILGKSEYYKLQAVLLAARCLSYVYTMDMPREASTSQAVKGIHLALLFFGTLLTTMSFRAISIDYTPRVFFQDSPEPSTFQTAPQRTDSSAQYTLDPIVDRTSFSRPQSELNNPSFSINDLAPLSRQAQPTLHHSPYPPLTPPPEENDNDVMDWTPSQQAMLRPTSTHRPSKLISQPPQPPPFRGHLPADVVSMEHRLRNPPNKPMFRKASEAQKQNFFKTPRRGPQQDSDHISDTGTEYEPSVAETETPATVKFAQPKLHLPSGQPADTGLERLLANAFSLDDEPQEVRTLQQQETQPQERAPLPNAKTRVHLHRLPVLLILVVSYFVLTERLKIADRYRAQFQLTTLILSSLASVRSLTFVLCKDPSQWSGSDLVIFMAELAASLGLASLNQSPSTASYFNSNNGSLRTFATTLIAIMAVQELWMIILEFWMRRENESHTTEVRIDQPQSQPSPMAEIEDQKSCEPSDRTAQAPLAPTQRSTRSQRKETDSPGLGSGFGSLSLGGNGGNAMGRSRRSNRSGMW